MSSSYVNSNWSYGPETAKLDCELWPWPLTLTFDGTMPGTLWKRCNRRTHRQTDGQTDRSVLRAARSQLKITTNRQGAIVSYKSIDMCKDEHFSWPAPCISLLTVWLFSHISALMTTSSNGNIFRVTGPLCGEFTGHRSPVTKASDVELWCFLWSAPE